MKRIIPVLVVTASVGLLAGLTVGNTYHPAAPAPATPAPALAVTTATETPGTAVQLNGVTYVPCPEEGYEGPTPCFWDAGARSNGKGQSFIWTGSEVKPLGRG